MFRFSCLIACMLLSACEPSSLTHEEKNEAVGNETASIVLDERVYQGDFSFGEGRNVSMSAVFQELAGNKQNENLLIIVHSSIPNDPTYIQGKFANGVMVASENCHTTTQGQPGCRALSDLGDPEFQELGERVLRYVHDQIVPGLRERFKNRDRVNPPNSEPPPPGRTSVALFSLLK